MSDGQISWKEISAEKETEIKMKEALIKKKRVDKSSFNNKIQLKLIYFINSI